MWIEFGVIDYKIIIPLIYPFFFQIRSILHANDEKALFGFFTNFCGYLLSGIIFLINNKMSNEENKKRRY
jgi:hypothetical protein